ncbi:unnamed protein product [Polarella glacialis]|uniref:Uncharacterized protein n=1 Tax=Polarella glacialis TaxID=89957 RepID=A0A813EIN1_POLGL|nr:unnamed protein product [Polarella glacialis]
MSVGNEGLADYLPGGGHSCSSRGINFNTTLHCNDKRTTYSSYDNNNYNNNINNNSNSGSSGGNSSSLMPPLTADCCHWTMRMPPLPAFVSQGSLQSLEASAAEEAESEELLGSLTERLQLEIDGFLSEVNSFKRRQDISATLATNA